MIYRSMYVDKIMLYADTDIAKEQFVSYRFDSMEYEDMTAKQMYVELKSRLYENGKTYIFGQVYL